MAKIRHLPFQKHNRSHINDDCRCPDPMRIHKYNSTCIDPASDEATTECRESETALLLGLDRLADDCGVRNIIPRLWVEHVKAVMPGTGVVYQQAKCSIHVKHQPASAPPSRVLLLCAAGGGDDSERHACI